MAINFLSFRQTDEWQLIERVLKQKIEDYTNQVVDAGNDGDTNKMMNIAGRIAEIKEILELPEYLFSETRAKEFTDG